MILGIDVSHHQGQIDWPKVATVRKFAILKATEGSTFKDSKFRDNVGGARAAGMVVGAYHFARPAGAAGPQVDHFLKTVAGTVDFLVLDLEDTGGLSASALNAWAKTFLDRLPANALLYTYSAFLPKLLNGQGLTHRRLWVAKYSDNQPAHGAWPKWSMWQYASSGTVPGIAGRVDENRFDGTLSELTGGAEPTPQPQPSKEVEEMLIRNATTGGLFFLTGGRLQSLTQPEWDSLRTGPAALPFHELLGTHALCKLPVGPAPLPSGSYTLAEIAKAVNDDSADRQKA